MTSEHSDNNTDADDLAKHMRVAPHREEQPELPSAAAPQGAAETTVCNGIVPPIGPQPGSSEVNRDSPRGQVDALPSHLVDQSGAVAPHTVHGDRRITAEEIAEEFAGQSDFLSAIQAHARACSQALPWKVWLRVAKFIARCFPNDPHVPGHRELTLYGDIFRMTNDQHWPTTVNETVAQMADALSRRRHAAVENRQPNALPSTTGSATVSDSADIYRRMHILRRGVVEGRREVSAKAQPPARATVRTLPARGTQISIGAIGGRRLKQCQEKLLSAPVWSQPGLS